MKGRDSGPRAFWPLATERASVPVRDLAETQPVEDGTEPGQVAESEDRIDGRVDRVMETIRHGRFEFDQGRVRATGVLDAIVYGRERRDLQRDAAAGPRTVILETEPTDGAVGEGLPDLYWRHGLRRGTGRQNS